MQHDSLVQTIPMQLAAQLRRDLLSGRFQPGEPVREAPLAQRFGVSRGPIRQVLQQLAHEGLLVARPNRGIVVAARPPKEVCEVIWPVRAEIETRALRQCFDDLNESDFGAWEDVLSRLELACQHRDHTAVLELNWEFHRSILVRAGLGELVPIWTWLVMRARPFYARRHRELEDLSWVYFVHAALVETLRGGDEEAAVAALSQHITDGEFNKQLAQRFDETKAQTQELKQTGA
jgi:DNA-binding GntR family transcriptional regulator